MSELINSQSDGEEQLRKEIKVDANGVGKATIRGTARLAGVAESSLRKSFTSASLAPSQLATMLMNKGFTSASLEAFSTEGIPDIAVSIILEYYAFDAGRYCSDLALKTYRAFAAIGVRAWMQSLTGWEPEKPENKPQLSLKEFLEKQLPEEPKDWEQRFPVLFWECLEELYGLRRGDKGCASFINNYIYKFFPLEVRDRLNEINPLIEGKRKNRQHQHFDDTLLKCLKVQIERVCTLLQASDTRSDFQRGMKNLKKFTFGSITAA